jgi:hypothetical protein
MQIYTHQIETRRENKRRRQKKGEKEKEGRKERRERGERERGERSREKEAERKKQREKEKSRENKASGEGAEAERICGMNTDKAIPPNTHTEKDQATRSDVQAHLFGHESGRLGRDRSDLSLHQQVPAPPPPPPPRSLHIRVRQSLSAWRATAKVRQHGYGEVWRQSLRKEWQKQNRIKCDTQRKIAVYCLSAEWYDAVRSRTIWRKFKRCRDKLISS